MVSWDDVYAWSKSHLIAMPGVADIVIAQTSVYSPKSTLDLQIPQEFDLYVKKVAGFVTCNGVLAKSVHVDHFAW